MMKFFNVSFLLIIYSYLYGAEIYPSLFFQQLKPLVEANVKFEVLEDNVYLKDHYIEYKLKSEKTVALGLIADESKDKSDIDAYVLAIRELQSDYDQIVLKIKHQLVQSIQEKDCKKFDRIVDVKIEELFVTSEIRGAVLNFNHHYCKNKNIVWIELLTQKETIRKKLPKQEKSEQKIVEYDANKHYKNTIPIIVFTNSTDYYVQDAYNKVISLFEKYQFRYVVYDIYASREKKALLKSYSPPNVFYYPTIVIGKQVVYSGEKNQIFEALKKEWFADNPMRILQTE